MAASAPDWEAQLVRVAATGDSVRQLTLGMAHELNNLVGGISALSEIYMQGMESGLPFKDGITLIHNSAGRLQSLLRELAAVNKPAQGARDYVNLAETIRAESAVLTHILPKNIRLETSLPDTELAALLDETSLRQILLSLALNLRDIVVHEQATGIVRIVLIRMDGQDACAELQMSAETTEGQPIPVEARPSNPAHLGIQVRMIHAQQAARDLDASFVVRDNQLILTLPLIA